MTLTLDKIRLLAFLGLMVPGTGTAATTILIDYDDEIAGNGIHDASIRNGGFEDAATGNTLPDIPFWNSYFPESDATAVLSTVNPSAGVNRVFASGFGGSGNRVHLAQTISAGEWTIQEGDVFTFSAQFRGGVNFDVGSDSVQLILHVVDGLGNPVPTNVGNQDRIVQPVADPADISGSSYFNFLLTTGAVPSGSPWIGNFLQARILVNGDRNEFALVDNVFLSATPVPEPGAALLGGLGLFALMRRRR